jgi:hypothetical protein
VIAQRVGVLSLVLKPALSLTTWSDRETRLEPLRADHHKAVDRTSEKHPGFNNGSYLNLTQILRLETPSANTSGLILLNIPFVHFIYSGEFDLYLWILNSLTYRQTICSRQVSIHQIASGEIFDDTLDKGLQCFPGCRG